MYCLETSNLVHRYSENDIVLDHVNLQVEEGSIYGFLGPNGAGKTTTLKLVLGLLTKQHGSISIFGKPFVKNRIEILKKTGSLIESPSLYGHLTAIENLSLLQKIYRCPTERIGTVLDLAGLSDTGRKKVNQFSLGMKQRLSLGIALLHQPSLLILDEPTNGLDPAGIIEMRNLLKKLNREEGITIVISSHLLSEIEKLVTHVGIINKGKLMFQDTLDRLIVKQQQSLLTVIETDDIPGTLNVLRHFDLSAQPRDGKIEMPPVPKEKIARINEALVSKGIDVYGLYTSHNDLEMIFMDLINT